MTDKEESTRFERNLERHENLGDELVRRLYEHALRLDKKWRDMPYRKIGKRKRMRCLETVSLPINSPNWKKIRAVLGEVKGNYSARKLAVDYTRILGKLNDEIENGLNSELAICPHCCKALQDDGGDG